MPYDRERANPRGAEVLTSDFIRKRLQTFSVIPKVDEEEVFIPVIDARELPSSHNLEDITRIVAVDGSVTSTPSEGRDYQVGAFKVGVVEESLLKLRDLRGKKYFDPADLEAIYRVDSIAGVLPGQGVRQSGGPEDRTWKDKFRYELFMNFDHLRTPGFFRGQTLTLTESLKMVLKKNEPVQCAYCKSVGVSAEESTVPFHRNANYGTCQSCKRGVYITDTLYIDNSLNLLENNKAFLSTMSIAERLVTAGLIEVARKNELETTAFITDGPLALFGAGDFINNHLLYQIQRQKPNPILFGLEKTGDTNSFSKLPKVDRLLKNGHFAMVTNDVASLIAGKASDKSSYFYGKRFLYRTRSGDKTFVVMVPPRFGHPYDRRDTRPDMWDSYPTLRVISELLEENKTDQFGVKTAAMSAVAKANLAASLPKVIGESTLTRLVEEILGVNNAGVLGRS